MNELFTDRCLLGPLQSGDRDELSQLYSDQDVRRFLGGPLNHEDFTKRFDDFTAPTAGRTWTIHLKATSVFVGIVSIGKHHDSQNQEVSFQFLPDFWGQGYAREVVGMIIEYAATVMKLTCLVAETQCANHASRRLLQTVGMEPVATLRRFGKEQILYHLALLSERERRNR